MIYLIGGSSHVGKTYIAQMILERLMIPYLCLDHLKMGFIRSKMTDLTVEDDDAMREWMWPFVAEIIKTAVENKQDMVIEGCYIPADWSTSFDETYLNHIRSVFLVMSEEYLRDHFDDVKYYANVMGNRLEDAPDLERLIACSRGFKEDCIALGTPFYEFTGAFYVEPVLDMLIYGK